MKTLILTAFAALAIICGACAAFAFLGQPMLMGGKSTPTQTMSVSISNTTFTNSAANAVVGAVSVTMSPASPAFSGSLSLTGTNSGGFHLVGTMLETNSSGTTNGTYSDVNIVATQTGVAPAQITPTLVGSSSLACARGPNYTGTIPPPAAAAGFTTCVANYDFSQPPFNNVSNWLDCAGATNAYWFAGAAPCSDWSIVTDGGQTVLDQTFTVADGNNTTGPFVSAAQTAPNGASSTPTNQLLFHNGHYTEATFMSMPDAYTACKQASCFLFDWWLYGYGPVLEQDFDEVGTDSFATSALHDGGAGNTGTVISNYPGFNPKVYQTIGFRLTIDNTEAVTSCTYLNVSGNPIGSGDGLECKGLGSIPGALAQGNFEVLWVGSATNVSPPVPINNNIDEHIKHILIFSCANWMNSSGCPNTPTLTTP